MLISSQWLAVACMYVLQNFLPCSNVPKPSNGTKPSNSPKASTASNTLNFAGKGIGEKKSLLPPLGKIKNHSDASKLNLVLVSNYLLIIEGHLKRTKVRRSRTNR